MTKFEMSKQDAADIVDALDGSIELQKQLVAAYDDEDHTSWVGKEGAQLCLAQLLNLRMRIRVYGMKRYATVVHNTATGNWLPGGSFHSLELAKSSFGLGIRSLVWHSEEDGLKWCTTWGEYTFIINLIE